MAHLRRLALNIIPDHAITSPGIAIEALAAFLTDNTKIAVITGAGISTDSGIPDYRSPGRPPHRPLQHSEFVESSHNRRRYWSRSVIGYPNVKAAQPNIGHEAIALANQHNVLGPIITQNVDGLHEKAGSKDVIALHGQLNQVICLNCHDISSRDTLQDRMLKLNRDLLEPYLRVGPASLRPDGDVVLDDEVYRRFLPPSCIKCQGTLMPNLIFFGGVVPPSKVQASYSVIDEHDALLVTGTSLAVWSSFRLVRRAIEQDKPVFVLNNGPTRADDYGERVLRANVSIADVLPAAVRRVIGDEDVTDLSAVER
eukprot:TRINITY_DN6902_c0_g1_i1.p1 TRINITY_DN6902_c0_g1~~TRINITY_DN6902_c0_g1_i1.p1  ORF type:complete len:312 (+),score=42.08 TRINITY_DN6902_c0_g1_i1:56-991(+)